MELSQDGKLLFVRYQTNNAGDVNNCKQIFRIVPLSNPDDYKDFDFSIQDHYIYDKYNDIIYIFKCTYSEGNYSYEPFKFARENLEYKSVSLGNKISECGFLSLGSDGAIFMISSTSNNYNVYKVIDSDGKLVMEEKSLTIPSGSNMFYQVNDSNFIVNSSIGDESTVGYTNMYIIDFETEKIKNLFENVPDNDSVKICSQFH